MTQSNHRYTPVFTNVPFITSVSTKLEVVNEYTRYPDRSIVELAKTARRKQLLDDAEEQGIGIVHIYNPEEPLGGLTVAFSKSNPYASGVMVDVAVNTCSEFDRFSKKIGTLGALEKFYAGETIQLPLLTIYAQENLAFVVKQAFSLLYFTVT